MKSPQVSGPWLDSWGGNGIALNHPSLYIHPFRPFVPCGTMFPRNSFFAGHMAELGALDTRISNESRRYSGLEVHAIIDQDTCVKRPLSEAIDDSPCDTWLHRTDAIQCDFGTSMGDAWMHQDG